MKIDVIINGFIYVIHHIMKNSHKLIGLALVIILTLGGAISLAVNSGSDLTGRVKLTREQGKKLQREMVARKSTATPKKVAPKTKTETTKNTTKSTTKERNAERYNDYVGNGIQPDANPVIETYLGACNDPFGSPTCVVNGEYTTYDLAYNNDEVVYTMRIKNTSATTPIYMDKVYLEYTVKGIDQTVWNSRAQWKIYDASAPNTPLTRGHVYNAANVNGYVDFDWSYPGNLLNPINQPPVIPPLGTQTYIVTADIVDDSAGPLTFDYIQVRANDSLTFTPVVGGTLSDAHNVNSHFIWHTAAGLYYNEDNTDLMDMWGGISNAFAQWRKRMWATPIVTAPVTLDIQVDTALNALPNENHYVYPNAPSGTQTRYVSYLNLTPSAPVALNTLRFTLNTRLRTDEYGTQITPAMCANLSQMGATLNAKLNNFNLQSNFGTLVTNGNGIVPLGSNYTSPQCDVDGYVDLNVGSFALTPNVPTHFELMVNVNPASIFNASGFYNDLFIFAINNAQLTTVATDTTSGQLLLPSQITAPGFSDYNVYVDMTNLSIMEPVSAGSPWPITAQQGQNDVLFGVFVAKNWSQTLSATLNELKISDEPLAINNAIHPDLTNIRLYEWDYSLNQPIGAPLASGLQMGPSNVVTGQSLNLNFPHNGLPGSEKFLAVVADISPTFATDAGYDVSYDSGTATNDNEIEIGLHVTGLTNPVTASDPTIPFLIRFNQSSSTINPFICPSWNTCDISLGNLVDVQPAVSPAYMTP
ncbi:MAG: hypothetical protein Q8P68_01155 [Candidatus Peregrinibacteria bacterium]|nr:hypothetical protein [Candidatus Peregrinibacteria bacterium]MDZ4244322.1 hypothetical protein [Candidatus Gracilibacteria bacterium]